MRVATSGLLALCMVLSSVSPAYSGQTDCEGYQQVVQNRSSLGTKTIIGGLVMGGILMLLGAPDEEGSSGSKAIRSTGGVVAALGLGVGAGLKGSAESLESRCLKQESVSQLVSGPRLDSSSPIGSSALRAAEQLAASQTPAQ